MTRRHLIFLLCLGWMLLTLFPLYWVVITSFKTPPAVSGGATYVPWIDFQPTLNNLIELFSGQRGNFISPFLNSTVVGLSVAGVV